MNRLTNSDIPAVLLAFCPQIIKVQKYTNWIRSYQTDLQQNGKVDKDCFIYSNFHRRQANRRGAVLRREKNTSLTSSYKCMYCIVRNTQTQFWKGAVGRLAPSPCDYNSPLVSEVYSVCVKYFVFPGYTVSRYEKSPKPYEVRLQTSWNYGRLKKNNRL